MGMGKLLLVYAMLLLCALSAAHAASYTVSKEAINDKIFADEIARISLTIDNGNQIARYQVYSDDPRWIVDAETTQIELQENEEATVEVTLDPTAALSDSGNYAVPIVVKSLTTDEELVVEHTVLIKSERYREYSPSVFLDVEVGEDGQVDPRDPIPVKLRVINRNPLNFETFRLTVESPLFNDEYETTLTPRGDFVKVLTFDINPQTEPQSFTVTTTMYNDQTRIGSPKSTQVEIGETFPEFAKETTVEEKTLYTHWDITFTNVGNVEKQEQLLLPISGFARFFTDASHEYTITEYQGIKNIAFEVTLAPGETTQITVTTNIRGFATTVVIIVILIALWIVLYYMFRSPIVILRHAKVLNRKDNAISKMKILINVRNRTNKVVESVKVYEKLPHIAEIDESFHMGTVKPSRVLKNAEKGTLVRWDFATFEPYEERIITYDVSPKLSILGDFSMPPTTLQVKHGKRNRKFSFKGIKIDTKEKY